MIGFYGSMETRPNDQSKTLNIILFREDIENRFFRPFIDFLTYRGSFTGPSGPKNVGTFPFSPESVLAIC